MERQAGNTSLPGLLNSDRLPLLVAVGSVTLFIVMMIIVDLVSNVTETSWPLWFLLFREGGPSEHISWFLLASAALLASATAARSTGEATRFWCWFAIGSTLLLIEDAGNTSHRFAYYLNIFANQTTGLSVNLNMGRLVVFAGLGAVMLVVLLLYRRVWSKWPTVRRVLIPGYIVYGFAALLSVPFNLVGAGYQRVGDAVLSGVFNGRLASLPEPIWGAESDNTGTVFMDLVVEESLEVLAAGLLATAALRGWLQVKDRLGTDASIQHSSPAD